MNVSRSNRAMESFRRQESRLLDHLDKERTMDQVKCFRCGNVIYKGQEVVRRTYGDYHAKCYREICVPGPRIPGIMLVLVLLFAVSCASAPQDQVAPGGRWAHGCTATRDASSGNIQVAEVVVVGILPQGTDYWVMYPGRTPRYVKGKPMAELLSKERFIPAFRCPKQQIVDTSHD